MSASDESLFGGGTEEIFANFCQPVKPALVKALVQSKCCAWWTTTRPSRLHAQGTLDYDEWKESLHTHLAQLWPHVSADLVIDFIDYTQVGGMILEEQ